MLQRRILGVELGLACAGAAALVAQVLLLREFLNVFGGNEIVVGTVLAQWLLLTGAGALTGQLAPRLIAPRAWFAGLLLCAGALLPILLAVIRLLRSHVPPGVSPALADAIFWGTAVLLPLCAINGFLVPLAARLMGAAGTETAPGRSYMLDTAGAALGGILCAAMTLSLGAFESAAVILCLNGAGAALVMLDPPARGKEAVLLATAGLVSSVILMLWGADVRTARWLFPGQDLLWQRDTAYGHLAATRYGSQITIHQNGLPAGSTDDTAQAEEIVHCALGQRPAARAVLLLSGGLLGVLREAAKYPADSITLVEPDPAVLRFIASLDPAAGDRRVRLVCDDPRGFVRRHGRAFDAIISAMPDPLSLGANRFFTTEFFCEARAALRERGVLGIGLGASENLATRWDIGTLASVASALRSAFPHVAVVPGSRVRIAASDAPLELRIDQALLAAGIPATHVNPAWISERLSAGRVEALARTMSSPAHPNRDFRPAAFVSAAEKWTAMGGGQPIVICAVALLLALILALVWGSRERAVSAAIGASGFAGMGIEVVVLLAFQIARGSLYLHVTAILSAFLVGAALGALRGCRSTGHPLANIISIDAALACTAMLAPVLLGLMHAHIPPGAPGWIAAAPFALVNAAAGYFVGAQFQPAARALMSGARSGGEATTGRLYGLDLLGGALGALAVTLVMIPALGLAATCYLIGAVKLGTATCLGFRRLRSPSRARAPESPRWAFAAMLGALALTGVLIAGDETSSAMGAIAGSRLYHGLALALLAIAYLDAMGMLARISPGSTGPLAVLSHPKVLRWAQFLGLGLVAFYPIFRCFFKVPYIFCHVCPRQCVSGYFRPYLVPAALLMNLRARHWCQHACPVGSLLHCQGGGNRAPRWLLVVPLALAALCAWAWFQIRADAPIADDGGGPWFDFFFKNSFTFSAGVLAAAAAVVLLGWIWRRAFCSGICPIGGVSELFIRGERWLNDRQRNRGKQ